MSAADLQGVDASDGIRDGSVRLRSVLSRPNSWKLAGERESDSMAYFIASASLFDGEFASTQASADNDDRFRTGGSYIVYAPESAGTTVHVALGAAGDIDDDGLGDIVLAAIPRTSAGPPVSSGGAYLIMGADLPHLDAADGRADGRIFLENVVRTPETN